MSEQPPIQTPEQEALSKWKDIERAAIRVAETHDVWSRPQFDRDSMAPMHRWTTEEGRYSVAVWPLPSSGGEEQLMVRMHREGPEVDITLGRERKDAPWCMVGGNISGLNDGPYYVVAVGQAEHGERSVTGGSAEVPLALSELTAYAEFTREFLVAYDDEIGTMSTQS